MSNPFDQFAADFQAALPPGAPSAAPPQPAVDPSNPFANGFGAPPSQLEAPAPSNKPVMNAPPQQQPPPNMYGNGYGSNGYGSNGYGSNGYGAPPMQQYGGGYDSGAPPTPQPYGMMGSTGSMGLAGPPSAAQGAQSSMNFDMNRMGAPAMNGMNGSSTMNGSGGPSMNGIPPQGGAESSNPPQANDPFSSFGGPAPPQPQVQPNPSFDANNAPQSNQQPPMQQPPQPQYGALALPPSQQQPAHSGVPSNDPFAAYGGPQGGSNDPFGAPSSTQPPSSDPYGGYGAPPANDPYGAPTGGVQQGGPASNDPFGGYGAPSSNPYGAPPSAAPPANDPFGGYAQQPPSTDPYASAMLGPPPPAPAPYADPWGAPPGAPDPSAGALVVSQQQSNPYAQNFAPHQQQAPPQAHDPFSVFTDTNQPPAPAPAHQQQQLVPAQPSGGGDLWGDLGFDSPPPGAAPAAPQQDSNDLDQPQSKPERHDRGEKKEDGLPPGGEWYDARIFTPTLGVMFFKPQELTDSLFLNTDRSIVDGLVERPVVAFIVEGSSARSAGVELGHVLLKVNGVDVKNPKEASRLIKEGPRPLPLLFYVPNTEVVVAEGEHMVKYDTRETTAPNSAKDWKPKYVVIGGIIAQPWMMNMYRSKSEYDIAVIETQARRPVSVKVKQFSLQGARIQNDWQGPQMVKYKNKLHPWKYIVVLPVARNPIKISSPNLAHLKPVHEGIRRVLLAQQRDRGSHGHTAAPMRGSPYSGGGRPTHHSDPYSNRHGHEHHHVSQGYRSGGY